VAPRRVRHEIVLNSRDLLVIETQVYNGRWYVSLRQHIPAGAGFKPGKAGITVSARCLPYVREAIADAIGALSDAGLIADRRVAAE
jgi:hypothetical protein